MSINRGRPSLEPHGIKPWIFYTVFAGLLFTNVLTLVAFLMSSDIANLLDGQNDRLHVAYQDRIVQLRQEVDRLYSRQYAQTGNVNLQMQELVAQQDMLTEQHQYVKALAAKAQELGLEMASQPVMDNTIVTGSISAALTSTPNDVDALANSITRMMGESRMALAGLSEAAIDSTDKIVSELDRLGIHPQLPEVIETATGGPFLPAANLAYDTPNLVDEANAVASSFERFRVARNVASQAPIQQPLVKKFRISSRFGNRKDPFLKKSAFHSGMDFAAPSGMKVVSAGPGKVVFAGRKSGYGKVVEVEHLGGLITRYAHLSAYLVDVGDQVEAGTPIAKVGSTGRSTGPHLHFEVRRKDIPIDPAQFLKAGDRLAAFL